MKKRIVAAAAAIVLVLSGCQATPEKGVVTSKNDGAFEEALEASPTLAPNTDQPPAAEAQTTAEPTVYEDTFDGRQSGGVTFHVKVAEPTVPGPMPVLRVRPLELTGELVRQVAQVFYGDGPVSELTGQMSRAEVEKALLAEKQDYADWQVRIEQDPTVDADDRDYVRQSFEDRIARLEEAYAAAPETVEQKPLDWQFHPQSYYPDYAGAQDLGHQYMKGLGQVNGRDYELSAMKRLGTDYSVQRLGVYPYTPYMTEAELNALYDQQAEAEPPAVDMDAARTEALELVKSMGIGEFAVVPDLAIEAANGNMSFDPNTVVLTPAYNGVPLTFHFGGFNIASKGGDEYASTYGYEYMTFNFDETGVTGFGWESMHQVVQTENDNVQILPFADVLAAAEDQMKIMDLESSGLLTQGVALSIDVRDVALGMSRIRMKDSATDYYITPTYTFYGTATYCDENGEPIRFPVLDEQGNETGETQTIQQVTELVVLNAVDGTAIDVRKGY